jgi:tRNA threonylcarbamoyladenosine biosynthesis protein TsaE
MKPEEFVLSLVPKSDAATLVTLSGELGAGKTTFAQGIARALGVQEMVTSPTFVIEKIYKLEHQKWERLIHIDAYRLKSAHELEGLGWKELLTDSGNLIVLEWPERVAEAMPGDAIRISFEINGEERILKLHGEKGGKK